MKHEFKRDMLKGTILPMEGECVTKAMADFFRYEKPAEVSYSVQGRRINHFMLGADPEFMFVIPGGNPEQATRLGLKAGLAFGADQNDRLVELRPAPSRSALEVLASTLAELRFLYRYLSGNPAASLNEWVGSAFLHGDGMGGHVHFGRKRPHQGEEVKGLDGLAKVMRAAQLFDTQGWNRRSQGDQFHQIYGAYGDTRAQKHGYEYRTLPTWLDNPRLGFLVLTLSKLVLVDPDITSMWTEQELDPWAKLQGLAKYYKGRDDDALLLYSMMESPSGFMYRGGDFRGRWGLNGPVKALGKGFIVPGIIEATPEDISDLFKAFHADAPLTMRECAPTWKTTVPEGYRWLPRYIEYRRRPNIGDILYDLVEHENMPFQWDFDSTRSCVINVPHWFDRTELNKIRGDIEVQGGKSEHHFHIRVGQEWRKGALLSHLRRVLLSGALPMWTAEKVLEDSHKVFTSKIKTAKSKSKYAQLVRRYS